MNDVQVSIDKDEVYPVYSATKGGYENSIEIPGSLWRRYQASLKAYNAIQAELAAYYDGSV